MNINEILKRMRKIFKRYNKDEELSSDDHIRVDTLMHLLMRAIRDNTNDFLYNFMYPDVQLEACHGNNVIRIRNASVYKAADNKLIITITCNNKTREIEEIIIPNDNEK